MKSYLFENKRNFIILLVILLGISLTGSFYLQKKSGYYVDEGMTLFLANGQYNGGVTTQSEFGFQDFLKEYVWKDTLSETVSNVTGMLQQVMGAGDYSQEGTVAWYDAARKMLQGESNWMSGEDLYRQLTVSSADRFDYLQVYINQAMDVHPPLYYFVVHMVFGIFSGKYSDAYLFGINLFFLLATCIVMYVMLQKLYKRPEMALCAVAVYGFSQGFLSCTLYFRMYAMETFAVMVTLYLYIYMRQKNWQCTRKERFLLGLTAVLGFMVHYYYILFLIPLFGIACIRMGKTHQIKELKKYIGTMVLAGIISLILWPFSLYHIFFGYRGAEAISNLSTGGLGSQAKQCVQIIKKAVFLDNRLVMLVVVLIIIITCIWGLCRIDRNSVNSIVVNKETNCLPELVIPMLFYCLVVIKVAPTVSDRYLMCLFPIIIIIVGMVVGNGIKKIVAEWKHQRIIAWVACGIYIIVSLVVSTPNYLYQEQANLKLGCEQDKKELNCLMVADDDYRGFPEAIKLSKFNQVMVIGKNDMDMLADKLPRNQEYSLLIYVFTGLDTEAVVQDVAQYFHREGATREAESDIENFKAYIL